MKRLATLLTIAGISLVGYTGAVYSGLNQEMPDSTPEPALSVHSEPKEQVHKPVVESAKPVQTTKPVEPIVPKTQTEQKDIEELPEWRVYLNDKLSSDPQAKIIIQCLDNYYGGVRALKDSAFRWLHYDLNNQEDSIRNNHVDYLYRRVGKVLEVYPEQKNFC